MKKIASITLIAVAALTVTGCNNQTMTVEELACEEAIQDYLASTNMDVSDTMINSGDLVTVDYIGRHNEYEIFDTSIQSVAEGCNAATPGRNYDEGLSFVVGAGKMISGFEIAVRDMTVGETKTVVLPPEQAYGEWSEENLVEMNKSDLPEGDRKKGDELPTFFGPMPITDVSDETVTIDTNPPLAGETLTFDITVTNVQDAEDVEIPAVDEEVTNDEEIEDTPDTAEPTNETGDMQ